eukprot:gene873-9784_t
MKSIRFVEKEKDKEKALKLFEVIKMNKLHIDEEYYLKILKTITENINSSFKIYNYMKKDGVKPTKETFIQLLRSCSLGHAEKSIEKVNKLLFEDAKKWKINRSTFMFNLALKSCAKQNDTETANKIHEEMKNENIKRDIFTYGLLIQIQCKSGNVNKAFDLFEQMKNEEVKPDVYIYNSLMTLCKNHKDNLTEISFELFRKMIEVDSIRPTLHSFSILLGALRKNNEFHRSILLFKELKYQEIEIDSPLMNNFAKTLAIGGFISESIEMVLMIRKKGFTVAEETYETVLRKSIKLSNKPKFEIIENILSKMRDDGAKIEIDLILENLLKNPELWSSILIPFINYLKKHFNFKPEDKRELISSYLRNDRILGKILEQ